MPWIVQHLWLIPALPVLAAGMIAVTTQPHRRFAAALAIGAMFLSLLLSLGAFAHTLGHHGDEARQVFNFSWLQFGDQWLKLGWVLDPLTAIMLVMVTFVGLLIFIYSVGYMSHDDNFTRFFCFLSLFAGAMLGVIIANSLLLLFICWELVGLTSYLLIGFWYFKPSAAAAAKKAFITTRIGDVALLLGMVWLYSQTGTLLFYDNGAGCLEQSAILGLVTKTTILGMGVSTAIGLLIFAGAVGKSGQVPLHVWLPDAMEGPTPVSALIHAATMVAAGVFLVARVYPIMCPAMASQPVTGPTLDTTCLHVITWVGAITAIFAASIAVARRDIKRILAYSTVSQLGYMMMGLGVGGVAVGMFHLITHAFFKALLFMGAGSVIHGCHEEQDIARMGGVKKYMPVTFATYAIGMLALCGFPLFFSGFWSKDAILGAAHDWVSKGPFFLGLAGAFLTAFYMTRQVVHVFFGNYRQELGRTTAGEQHTVEHAGEPDKAHPHVELAGMPHESPITMTGPLVILAFFAIVLGFIGTPMWPWFQAYLAGGTASIDAHALFNKETLLLMGLSTLVVLTGLIAGWNVYGCTSLEKCHEGDILEKRWPNVFRILKHKSYVDEAYEHTVIAFNAWWSNACDWLDLILWNGLVHAVAYVVVGLAFVDKALDEFAVNLGFDKGCEGVSKSGGILSRVENGRVQSYLRIIGLALALLALLFIWGCGAS